MTKNKSSVEKIYTTPEKYKRIYKYEKFLMQEIS